MSRSFNFLNIKFGTVFFLILSDYTSNRTLNPDDLEQGSLGNVASLSADYRTTRAIQSATMFRDPFMVANPQLYDAYASRFDLRLDG